MSSSEPSWRVKTRPCLFYPQGRCVFGDSCNFLHTNPAAPIPETVSLKIETNELGRGPSTPRRLPEVIVNSPSSIRSPTRSPRTTSLLLALRDVIGDPDEEDLQGNVNEASSSQPRTTPWNESLPTLVNQEGFGFYSQEDQDSLVEVEDELLDDFEGNWTAISDYSDEDSTTRYLVDGANEETTVGEAVLEPETLALNEDVVQSVSSPTAEIDEPCSPDTVASSSHRSRDSIISTGSGLLSPIELSIRFPSRQHFGSFSTGESSSIDSGYAENWKPPTPLLGTPPRSPSIASTFDLLASPFGSHSARILSPRLGAFLPNSPLSPARTASPGPSIREDVELLDLGLDSPTSYRDSSEDQAPNDSLEDVTASWNNRVEAEDGEEDNSAGSDSSSGDDDDFVEEESYGHTSIWNSDGNPTAVFMGSEDAAVVRDQVNDAIRRSSRTPTHFLASREIDFEEDAAIGHSSLPHDSRSSESLVLEYPAISDSHSATGTDDEAELSPDVDDTGTAFLAYLRSPPAKAPENDTLNNLYDIYSVIASPKDVLSDSMRNARLSPPPPDLAPSSNVSTPSSSLKGRVFTPPPPTRKRSGTVTLDSPTSLSSPMTSLDSESRGRASPFSPPLDDRPTPGTSGSQSSGQDVEISRKIPFGFRNSISLGRASRSSLMTNRNTGRLIPPSPLLETQIDRPPPEGQPSETSPSPTSSTSHSASSRGLKPLRLSTILNANSISRSMFQARISTQSVHSSRQSGTSHRTSLSSATVSSTHSLSHNRMLSSARSSLIPQHIRNSLSLSEHGTPSPSSPDFFNDHISLGQPQSAPADSWRNSRSYHRPSSRISEPTYEYDDEDGDDTTGSFRRGPYDETIRRPIPIVPHTAPVTRAPSVLQQPPVYAPITPRPTLMFAIASDNVDEVRQVLESGDANPNDSVGPQSALAFTLTNDKLANKLDIVKTLLAYGADPSVTKSIAIPEPPQHTDVEEHSEQLTSSKDRSLLDEMDPATRYYIERADAIHTRRTSALIHRSFFQPLTRVRYELVGQDRALEQLFRVLSMHSRQLATAPVVVMLCGPSGHGKSLLARKFGALLDVPTHTVNMTTLRSTHDLWQSYSMSPYETPTTCTLAEFLINNEGKRCVVVLDEIEKTMDEKTLWSLLMPWELGRCAFEANSRHVDVQNVVWLGTSNIGHDLVFQHKDARKDPEELMSREEYVQLMAMLRPKVSERLGASVLSRITTVLPFVPFTLEELKAICSEALYSLGGESARSLSNATVASLINTALAEYSPVEGARSLYRAMSNQLVDLL